MVRAKKEIWREQFDFDEKTRISVCKRCKELDDNTNATKKAKLLKNKNKKDDFNDLSKKPYAIKVSKSLYSL